MLPTTPRGAHAAEESDSVKMIGRAAIGLVVVTAGFLGMVWMLHGPEAHSTTVNNSQVLSALLAAATLVGTVVVWWRSASTVRPPIRTTALPARGICTR